MSGPSLATLLSAYPLASGVPTSLARAAVLAVLREGNEGVEVLLIQRTDRAGDPASGQVAFPGGGVDPEDPSLEATALRECEEEVGIGATDLAESPRFVRIGWAFASRVPIGIFAAPIARGARVPHPASPEEVAAVFWMSRSALNVAQRIERETQFGRRTVDATIVEGRILWGFTRLALLDLFGARGAPSAVEWKP